METILPFFQSQFEGYQVLWVSFLLIVASKYAFPFPEDLTILFTGYLAATAYSTHPAWGFWLGCVLAVVIADGSLYGLARCLLSPESRIGGRLRALSLGTYENPRGRIRQIFLTTERGFQNHGNWALFFARLLPYSRSPVFLFAGATSIPLGRYLRYEMAGALCSASISFSLGFFFSDEVDGMAQKFSRYQWGTLVVLGIALAIGGFVFLGQRRQK